ncbi:MAG: Hpt domain-containing protein [Bryobacteraceae bacterium]
MAVPNETVLGPVLDYDLAMQRVGGDTELLKELGQLFQEEYPRLMAELRAAHQQGDAKQVERAAHGLKGSIANFGAKRAVDAASQIEQLGRGGSLSPVAELLQSLDLALQALQRELAQL